MSRDIADVKQFGGLALKQSSLTTCYLRLNVVFVVALFLFVSSSLAVETYSFQLTGNWVGGFSRDGSIERADMTFSVDGDSLHGSYSIPELGLFDEPLTEVGYTFPVLTFHCLHGQFVCQVDTMYQEITGINERWQPPVRVHFKQAERQWPQTRKQDVTFRSGDVMLAGTIYRPEQIGSYKAVVILHGSTVTTRSEWTYRSRGEGFARNGHIALVFDRRGSGDSGGNDSPSFREQAQDATAAIDFLRGQPEVNPSKVGVMAASQSGWVAPLLGTQANPAFFILNSCPVYSPEQQEKDRVEFTLRQEGISEDSILIALLYVNHFFDVVNGKLPFDSLKAHSDNMKAYSWSEHLQLITAPDDLDWFRLNAYEPANDLKKIQVPVLALYGENDPMVPPERNAALMEKVLKSSGNQKIRVIIFSRGSHLIEDWGTLAHGAWQWPDGYWKWSRRAPGYFETVYEWMAGLP